jgi:thioredoxin-like negative regulator of GroEL
MQDKKVNGRQITFIDVDCDADTATAETFEVKGYPTIKLVKDGQVIEYDAKPDKDTLMEFLQTTV